MCRVRPIREIRVAGRSYAKAAALTDELSQTLPAKAHAVPTYREALADTAMRPGLEHAPTGHGRLNARPLRKLPDLPQNASLLAFLRSQASPPPAGRVTTLWAPGSCTHRTRSTGSASWPRLAAGRRLRVPLLACKGVAEGVALGTGWPAVRIDRLPANVEAFEPA